MVRFSPWLPAVLLAVLSATPHRAEGVPVPTVLRELQEEGFLVTSSPLLFQGKLSLEPTSLRFRLVEDQEYETTLLPNPNVPGQLTLEDEKTGKALPVAQGRHKLIAPRTGTYRLRLPASGVAADYRLELRLVPNPFPFDRGVRRVGKEGVTINDQLTRADPMDKVLQRSHCKVYLFRMFPGRTYVIDHMARFDAYLRLEDHAGKQLGANDDGGVGLNSRLIFRPPAAGIYRVIPTSLGGGVIGPFTLTIREQ